MTMPEHSNNPSTPATNHDLASAANAVSEFHGDENDDIFTWERAIKTTSAIFTLDEKAQLKLISCRLRGKASQFLSNALTDAPWLTAEELLNRLKKQFSNTTANHKRLNQFLAIKTVSSRKAYEEMLDLATDTYQRRSISEESLIRLTITKCPPMLRSMFIKYTYNDGYWYEFLKEARQNAWVAFADEQMAFNDQMTSHDQIYEIRNQKYAGKKYNGKNQNNQKKNKLLNTRTMLSQHGRVQTHRNHEKKRKQKIC
ncbi:hypothetical protein GVAV_000756 [Gurleya vavrai]